MSDSQGIGTDGSGGMTTAPAAHGGLDDVMLAMDVVDTLRHRKHVVDTELDAEARERALVARLAEIYKAQGIDVPDRVLREGVKALEEQRFVYSPPRPSFSVSLAKLYISRDRWLKPVLAGLAALVAVTLTYQMAFVGPERARAAAVQVELAEGLPAAFTQLAAEIDAATEDEDALVQMNALLQGGRAAIAAKDVASARDARDGLQILLSDLQITYNVTVVSRPGEMSGVFRIPDDVPDARNYYLIVEALDPLGRAVPVTLVSEETQGRARVSKWGQRVSEEVFNTIAADKRDDQIIQNAVIGEKATGELTPVFTVPVEDGVIVSW